MTSAQIQRAAKSCSRKWLAEAHHRSVQHPLFNADASQVDKAMLDSFLALDLPESYTVEYKSAADNAVLEAVASLANTFGGIVLVGIANRPDNRDRPGDVKGVASSAREPLINKMATMFAPAGWTPEVLAVPIAPDRDVLVVRIDTENTPRPLMYQGRVPIRMEARKGNADLGQILRLADEGGAYPTQEILTPNHQPSGPYPVMGMRIDDPAVVVRAFTSAAVLRRMARARIDSGAHHAILKGLSQSRLPMALLGLGAKLRSGEPVRTWQLHGQFTTSRVVRMWTGHVYSAHPDWPLPVGPFQSDRPHIEPGVRAHCVAAINGVALDIGVDIALWAGLHPPNKLEWRHVEQSAHDTVGALTSVHQELLRHVIGEGAYPLPNIELHIEAGVNPQRAIQNQNRPEEFPQRRMCGLEEVVDMSELGPHGRRPDSVINRGSENLSADLIAKGDINGAVSEAISLINMDWGYLERRA